MSMQFLEKLFASGCASRGIGDMIIGIGLGMDMAGMVGASMSKLRALAGIMGEFGVMAGWIINRWPETGNCR
jgi:hypothetical protein